MEKLYLVWCSAKDEEPEMTGEFSSFFYRNPASLKKLERDLRKELAEFKPVQNDHEAVLKKIQELKKQIEINTKALREGTCKCHCA